MTCSKGGSSHIGVLFEFWMFRCFSNDSNRTRWERSNRNYVLLFFLSFVSVVFFKQPTMRIIHVVGARWNVGNAVVNSYITVVRSISFVVDSFFSIISFRTCGIKFDWKYFVGFVEKKQNTEERRGKKDRQMRLYWTERPAMAVLLRAAFRHSRIHMLPYWLIVRTSISKWFKNNNEIVWLCVCVSFRLRLKPKCIQIARRVCVGWLIGTMALVVGIFAQLHVNWNVETHVLLVHHIHKVSQQQNKNNGRRMFFNIFFPLSEIY